MEMNITSYSDFGASDPFPKDPALKKCWSLNTCDSCIDYSRKSSAIYACGWCPYSNTCLPANSILSPVTNSQICPLSSERWELRTRTFGCNMSTRNFLSIFTTVVATLLVVALLVGLWAWWKRRERRRQEWDIWGESEEPEGFWAWLGLDNPFEGWGQESWGGWTRGWLLWRRDTPQRIPGAWEEDEAVREEEGERRPLLR